MSARRCLALHLVGGGSCLRLGLASISGLYHSGLPVDSTIGAVEEISRSE